MIEKKVRTWSFLALGAAGIVPFAVACAANNGESGVAGAGSAPYGYGYPPPQGYPQGQPQGYPGGYGQQPGGYPQGYPTGAPPQQGYPQGGQQPGYPPGTAAPPGYPPQQPPGTQPGPAPTGSAPPLAPTDPNSLPGILQGLQGALQGQTAPGGGASGDVTDLGLRARALMVAPGMQPEGDELKQTLQQGQHAVMLVTLKKGECYTIVGFSMPGAVTDIDLNLLAPPFYLTLAGQDLSHNNTPVIGASPNPMCPVFDFPLQYKLDVVAAKGAGAVAVQLYSKRK